MLRSLDLYANNIVLAILLRPQVIVWLHLAAVTLRMNGVHQIVVLTTETFRTTRQKTLLQLMFLMTYNVE